MLFIVLTGALLLACGSQVPETTGPTPTHEGSGIPDTPALRGRDVIAETWESEFKVVFQRERTDVDVASSVFVWQQWDDTRRFDATWPDAPQGALLVQSGSNRLRSADEIEMVACKWTTAGQEAGQAQTKCGREPYGFDPILTDLVQLGDAYVVAESQSRVVLGRDTRCYALEGLGFNANVCTEPTTKIPLLVSIVTRSGSEHRIEATKVFDGSNRGQPLGLGQFSSDFFIVPVDDLKLPQEVSEFSARTETSKS